MLDEKPEAQARTARKELHKMALFDRNIVRGVALVIVLKGVFISCMALTEPSNVCNSDDTLACRYDCIKESIQEHCASETEKDGYCCPGHYRTNLATCQECPGAHVMPDVNNCSCSCLLCAECPRNDTIKTRCSITTDTACYGTKDPTPRAHSACPWIKTSSAPTTQVLTTQVLTTQVSTTEAASVNTPSDPQRSKSERIYEGGFYTFMVLFILLFGFVVLICCYLCYAHHSDETEQPDGGVQTWKGVASIVAEQICRTCAECRAACRGQSATATGGQSSTATGGQSATATGGQSATATGGQSATPTGGQSATPTGGQSATLAGGQSATPTGSQSATPTGGQSATPTGGQSATPTGGQSAFPTGGQSATPTGGQSATPTGGQSATATGGQSATLAGGQSATPTGGQSATPTGGQSATPTGGQSATPTGSQSATPTGSQPHNMSHDETDEHENQKTDKKSRTVCYRCQQVIGEGNAAPPGDQSGGRVQAGVQEREDANHNDSGHVREPGELERLLSGTSDNECVEIS